MDTHIAKTTLSDIRTLIEKAKGRSITEQERGELERLCDRLKSGLPGAPEFNERCDELCLLMFADGLFHDKNQKGIKRILGRIDELRDALRD